MVYYALMILSDICATNLLDIPIRVVRKCFVKFS